MSTFLPRQFLGFRRRRAASEAGFTVIELLVYLIIAVVIVGSVYQLLIGQNQLYMKQRELTDVRSSLRGAAALLGWEFRQASAAGGDFYSIGMNSFAVRSVQGGGIICGEDSVLLHYGLWGTSGEIGTTTDDSALVFAAADNGTDDDTWKVVRITNLLAPGAGSGVEYCAWSDSTMGKGKGKALGQGKKIKCKPRKGTCIVPDTVVVVTGDMDGVYMGALFRAFRRVEYGLFQEDGRWWLGRKVGGAASYEKMTGPLSSPADSGLVFTYYNRLGNTTAAADSVALVEIRLRGESFGKVRKAAGDVSVQQETLTTRVSLRG